MKAYHTRPLLERMANTDSPMGRHAARFVDAEVISETIAAPVAITHPVARAVKAPAWPTPLLRPTGYSTVRFCKDCAWHSGGSNWGFSSDKHMCSNPKLLDMVTGEHSECKKNRYSYNRCGKDARYYFERQPEAQRKPLQLTYDPRPEPDDYALPISMLAQQEE